MQNNISTRLFTAAAFVTAIEYEQLKCSSLEDELHAGKERERASMK